MKEIHISVREGVALQTDHTPYITGDGEYRVVFDLEKEWEAHPLRTARFQTEGSYVDVVFRGNQCRVPVFTYARTLEVGIFAGNLRTTTPARIFLREGIRSAWGSPEAPAPNVYDQLMEALEDNGIVMEQHRDTQGFPVLGKYFPDLAGVLLSQLIWVDAHITFPLRPGGIV